MQDGGPWLKSYFLALIVMMMASVVLQAQSAPETQTESTRAGTIEKQELEKAKHLTTVAPPHGEAEFDQFEKRVVDPLMNPNGLTAKVGGLPTGGGFSLGPRYTRRDLLREHLIADFYAVGSTKKWYRGEASFTLKDLFSDHFELKTNGAYENAASMFYYGQGSNSRKEDKSDFRREFTSAHLQGTVKLFDQKLKTGYSVGGLLVNVGPGDLSDHPSSSTIFTEANTPGLTRQTNFIVGTSSVQLDLSKPSFSNAKGLTLEAADSQFWDQGNRNASFHLLQTQATYSLPFMNGMRTVAFRARNETTFHGDNQVVPFYLQPTLGGPDNLRGYDRYRFYGNGASSLNAEYRWSVSGTLEMAVFGDGGNVYQRAGLIGFRDMRGSGGIGVRVKQKQQTVMRFDLGYSSEGVKVWFVFNGVFGRLSRSY